MTRRVFSLLFLVVALALPVRAETKLQEGDRVAICGDSITEQKEYSVFIQDYLLMCQPQANLRTAQFGWGGETSWGFLGRMNNDVLWLKPTVATTCYGMNDGGYSPMTEEKARRYKEAQTGIVREFKKAGTRVIIVGSPGVVDADTFRKDPEAAAMYNKTLAGLRDIAKQVAADEGVVFANVFDPMMTAMTQAKAKLGREYHVAGGDGVHPAKNGQLVMAYAFLKAMGCDGNLGTITVDLAANKAGATDGHKVLSYQGGVIELESTRYPFCFYGDATNPSSTRSILPFVPFNDELNRLTLMVKGGSGKMKVTWGNVSKEFAATDLDKGINLAAEFLDNPFSEQFQKVEQVVRAQQNYETPLNKNLLHELPTYRRYVPEAGESIDQIAAALQKKQKGMADASSAAVTPVKHTIKVEAVK